MKRRVRRSRSRRWRAVLWLLLLPLAPAALTAWRHPRRPDWTATNASAAAALGLEIGLEDIEARHENPLWIDARHSAAYYAAHVPDALLLNDENWTTQFTAVMNKWDGKQTLVVYCGGGTCDTSAVVARRLRHELGFERVFSLRGGWDAWRAAELAKEVRQ